MSHTILSLVVLIVLSHLTACGGGSDSVQETPDPVTSLNTAPTISGSPLTSVVENSEYSFTPVANDIDGDTLSFTINNTPSWASFSSSTGVLTGIPDYSSAALYSDIIISVSDGSETVSLPEFSITVLEYNPFEINTDNHLSSISTNLGTFSSSSPEWGFVDAWVKTSPWFPNFCSSHDSVMTDQNGWITSLETGQCAGKFLFNAMQGRYPVGEYVILWEGDGSFSIEQDGVLLLNHTQGSPTTISENLNRATFNVASSSSNDGIYFELSAVANDYLRNVRIILPGGSCGINQTTLNHLSYCQTSRGGENTCPASQTCFDFETVYWDRFRDSVTEMNQPKLVFHPVFLDRLKSYQAIRFMKWSSNHESMLENWDERAQLQKDTYADDADFRDDKSKTTRGVPIEIYPALGNALSADIYLTLPARSTNEFNVNYANLIAEQLNADLSVYLEYNNEVWNSEYALDKQYMREQAIARNIETGATDFLSDGLGIARFYSERTIEVMETWTSVFENQNDEDRSSQLVRVLATFAVDHAYTTELLDWNAASQSGVIDALAIGAYFQGDLSAPAFETEILSIANNNDLDSFFTELNLGGVLSPNPNSSTSGLVEINQEYQLNFNLANSRNLSLIAYESGFGIESHVFSEEAQAPIEALSKNAINDSRMKDAMLTNLNNWKNAQGGTLFHFNNADDGQIYGALEYQTQPRLESPKYDALMSFIEDNLCWWDKCASRKIR